MTPEKQAILDAATARPWEVCDDEPLEVVVGKSHYNLHGGYWIAQTQTAANSSLIVIAVNSYEAQSALIERLVKAVRVAEALFAKGHAISRFNWGTSALRAEDIAELNEAPAIFRDALAEAKKVTP
jgi:hypothetical protein